MCSLYLTPMCKRLAVSRPENTLHSGHTALEESYIGLGLRTRLAERVGVKCQTRSDEEAHVEERRSIAS